MTPADRAAADQGAEIYDGPTVDHSTPGEAPPFPADRPSTDALLGALPGLRYENDGHGAAGFCTNHAQPAPAVVVADTEGIARVLLEHTRFGIWECACGGFHLYNGDPEVRRKRHNEHQAAAVAAYLAGEPR